MKQKRVGYHRISDDSVSSWMVPESEIVSVIKELASDPDIDQFWVKDDDSLVKKYGN